MEKWFDVNIFLKNPLITFIKIFKRVFRLRFEDIQWEKVYVKTLKGLGLDYPSVIIRCFPGTCSIAYLAYFANMIPNSCDFIFLSIFIMSTLVMSFTIIAACLHVLQILKKKSILSLLCSGHWEPHFGPLEPSDLHWIQTIIRNSFLKFFSWYMSVNKMQTLLSTLFAFPVTPNIHIFRYMVKFK